MDQLVISILEGQRRFINKNMDKVFTSFQNRLIVIMDPLGHLCSTLKKIKNSFETTPDDSAHVHIDNIENNWQQSVVWVKQM